jgi:hypothetical protein
MAKMYLKVTLDFGRSRVGAPRKLPSEPSRLQRLNFPDTSSSANSQAAADCDLIQKRLENSAKSTLGFIF